MNQVDYPPYPPYYDQVSSYNSLQPLSPPHEAAYSNGFLTAAYSPQRWPSASVATNVCDLRSDYATASPPLAWSSTSPSPSAPYISRPPLPTSNQQSTFDRLLSSRNNRPTSILKCSCCKATQSPEWRKGPSGKKELCNACGLRYARSRAKEGPLAAPPCCRKDKSGLSKRESATPPSYAPYPTAHKGSSRRDLDHGSPSHSGGEAYTTHLQHHHPCQNQHVLDAQLSPSPPPAASGSANGSLVHYASGREQRHEIHHKPPFSTTSNTLYSPSSPAPHQNYSPHSIPSPSVYHHHHEPLHLHAHHSHHTVSHPQLPLLDQIKPPHAPIAPSAYEHERDTCEQQSPLQGLHQRMPPPPLSAGAAREGYRR